MFTPTNTDPRRILLLDSLETGTPMTALQDEYCAHSQRQLDWNSPDDDSHGLSVFEPNEDETPPPLPYIDLPRSVLLHNLRALGYDLSQVAANDNDPFRLATALEVALCHKRGLFWLEDIAAALDLSVDAVRAAANDLQLATWAR